MNNRVTIRRAQIGDMFQIVALAELFVAEKLAKHGFTIDPLRLHFGTVHRLLSDHAFIIFVAAVDVRIVGFVVGEVQPSWLDPAQQVGVEKAWFIHPEHRTGKTAILLFEALEDWFLGAGVSLNVFAHMDDAGSAGVRRFYHKHGYASLEAHCVKRRSN